MGITYLTPVSATVDVAIKQTVTVRHQLKLNRPGTHKTLLREAEAGSLGII